MDDVLYQYNPWWEGDTELPDVQPRPRYVDRLVRTARPGRAVFVSGLRRVGKSTILKLFAARSIRDGRNPRTVLYVSLDDYVLADTSIVDLIARFRQLHRHRRDESILLLLDEVTAKGEFQQQIKTLLDRERVAIVASSSSASLLRDDRGTLTGRKSTLEIMPLTLDEYLEFRGVSLKQRDASLLEEYFQDYARDGGLPEHVLYPARDYLMNLVEDIIQRDITAYHGLRDHHVVRDFFTLLMERAGKQVSINRLARILGLSPDTTRRYLAYFADAYLVHLVPRHGKLNERRTSPSKLYSCDLGITHLFVGDRDWGAYFENYVYLLLRQHQDVFYVREGTTEIDFLTQDGTLIEVKFHDEMRDAQRQLFGRFKATRKWQLTTVRDLSVIESTWGGESPP